MRRKIPPTSALLCFEAAARAGSFAAGARAMNLSQSAFSRQIQGLEEQTGQTLFNRARQRVQLTGAGQMLLQELAPQLEALEATFYRLRTRDNPYGAINIGTYPTLGSRWLMPRLAQLAQAQPRLTVNTITYLDNDQVDASLVDLAIVQGDAPWPGFRADLLMPETLVAVAAPGLMEPQAEFPAPAPPGATAGQRPDPARLLSHPALQHSTRPLSWQIWFDDLGVPLPAQPSGPLFSQFEMLIDAVKYGHGTAILPELLVRRELDEGTLVLAHPHRCTPPSAYWLLTPQAKAGTSRIERVRRWLLETAAGDRPGNS